MNFGRFPRAAALLTLSLGMTAAVIPAISKPAFAQQADDRTMAGELEAQGKFDRALPYLERLAKDNPLDGEILFRYGFALNVTSIKAGTPEELKRIRLKVRKILLDSKQAGCRHPVLDSILNSIPEDGSGGKDVFSAVPEADRAMQEAEKAFASGNFDVSIEQYQKALKLDPTLYSAALFTGDSYFKRGYAMKADAPERSEAFKKAEEWFARAITIDPDRETAYRYWGTVLLETGRLDECKSKVVEAYITEPYNRLSTQGLVRWAKAKGTRVGHPVLGEPKGDVTPSQGKDGKTQININLDPAMLESKDGRSAWLMFDLSRAVYVGEMFKVEHPGETEYRHSLKEEVHAYQGVLTMVRNQLKKGEIKENKLNPGLKVLLDIDKAGLLESYILLARADRGIAQDFPAYLKTSRDKLRQYVLQFVTPK